MNAIVDATKEYDDGIHNLLEVIIRGQQRITEHDLLEGIRIACQLILCLLYTSRCV